MFLPLRAALFLATSSVVCAPLLAQVERQWSDGELGPLAKSLAAYGEARKNSLGLDKAMSELARGMQELAKAAGGKDPLRFATDMGRALWLSQSYPRAPTTRGRVSSDVFTDCSIEGGLEYSFWLPKDYDPGVRSYPLILAIPDENETTPEHIRTNWFLPELRDGAILVSPRMPKDQAEWTRVMVNGRPGGLSHVLTALRMATGRFAVDFDRVYVIGRGKGVPAAIAAGNTSPQDFAGVLGRAGDAGVIGPENFANLPTYFAGAGARASAFQEAAVAAGYDHCTLDPTGTEKELWAWIQRNPRRTWPTRVTVVPGDPFPTRCHWLRIYPSATAARATATSDRKTNTITIQAEGISDATVYLNDVLVDLDKPVRVVCNGVEHVALAQRHLPSTLEMIHDGTSDAGCVYVAQATIPVGGAAEASPAVAAPAKDPEFEKALVDAGVSPQKLWDLYLWCKSSQREALGEGVLLRLLRRDPEHKAAHEALGHQLAAGQWFTTPAALARFQASQDPKAAAEKGHIEFKSVWMHPEDRALTSKGWLKDHETGQWLTPTDRKRLAEGWVRQDLEWIAPAEVARLDEGRWRVEGEWLDIQAANLRHSRIDSMWRIPSADVLLHTTVDREVALGAIQEMGRAMHDLRRVFGAEPALPLRVGLLRDEEQYDRFAFGDPNGRQRATHAGRLHSVHSAYFAESWFPRVEGKLEFAGMGVGYWDARIPAGNLFGRHAARLAVGLSYADALDPSPKAVRQAMSAGPTAEHYAAYQAEKQLPAWLRYGGAVYAERFFRDDTVAEGGDPWWARNWSLDNLRKLGGLRSLPRILEFPMDPDHREEGLKLLIESGLVVAFMVDGNCAPVMAEHANLKKALVSGRLHPNHVKALTDALLAHEAELKAFAGM